MQSLSVQKYFQTIWTSRKYNDRKIAFYKYPNKINTPLGIKVYHTKMKYIYTTLTSQNDLESCHSQSWTYIRSGAEWNLPSCFSFTRMNHNNIQIYKWNSCYYFEPAGKTFVYSHMQTRLMDNNVENNQIASFHVSARAARFFSSFKQIMLLNVVKCVSHDNFSSFNQSCYWFVTLSPRHHFSNAKFPYSFLWPKTIPSQKEWYVNKLCFCEPIQTERSLIILNGCNEEIETFQM